MGKSGLSAACLIAGVLLSGSALATEQVYRPVSPTFGGNALNGNFLLSTAQVQGNGVKSGQQGPDLSGLNNALSGIGSGSQAPIIINGGTIPSNP
jgi:curli production assembly/transport component CsgF